MKNERRQNRGKKERKKAILKIRKKGKKVSEQKERKKERKKGKERRKKKERPKERERERRAHECDHKRHKSLKDLGFFQLIWNIKSRKNRSKLAHSHFLIILKLNVISFEEMLFNF